MSGSTTDGFDATSDEDGPAPVQLRHISLSSWVYAARRTGRGFWRHQSHDLAAGLTYHSVLAVFPALVTLVSLLGVIGAGDENTQTALAVARLLVPTEALAIVEPLVKSLTDASSRTATLVGGVVLSLWFVTLYVLAVGRALNRIYEVREGRPLLNRILRTVALTGALGVLVLLAAVLMQLSQPVMRTLGSLFGVGSGAVALLGVLKWLALAVVLAVMVGLLYSRAPNVTPPRHRWVSPGAVLAVVLWMAGSLLFGVYVRNVGSYERTYGALAGLIVLLVWLWVSNLALLLGAEVDLEVERVRELQAGVVAEQRVQLEPRNTRLSDKMAARDQGEVDRGRRLREQWQPPE